MIDHHTRVSCCYRNGNVQYRLSSFPSPCCSVIFPDTFAWKHTHTHTHMFRIYSFPSVFFFEASRMIFSLFLGRLHQRTLERAAYPMHLIDLFYYRVLSRVWAVNACYKFVGSHRRRWTRSHFLQVKPWWLSTQKICGKDQTCNQIRSGVWSLADEWCWLKLATIAAWEPASGGL